MVTPGMTDYDGLADVLVEDLIVFNSRLESTIYGKEYYNCCVNWGCNDLQ